MKNIDLISSLQQESQTTPEPKVIFLIFLIIFIYRKKKKNGIGQIMMTMKRKN
jgi:hypothetical protein